MGCPKERFVGVKLLRIFVFPTTPSSFITPYLVTCIFSPNTLTYLLCRYRCYREEYRDAVEVLVCHSYVT